MFVIDEQIQLAKISPQQLIREAH